MQCPKQQPIIPSLQNRLYFFTFFRWAVVGYRARNMRNGGRCIIFSTPSPVAHVWSSTSTSCSPEKKTQNFIAFSGRKVYHCTMWSRCNVYSNNPLLWPLFRSTNQCHVLTWNLLDQIASPAGQEVRWALSGEALLNKKWWISKGAFKHLFILPGVNCCNAE